MPRSISSSKRTTRFRFVATEEELNALPIEDDEIEMIVGSRSMSVYDWIEDEAILSLPLVPRHDECSAPSKTEGDVAVVPRRILLRSS